MRPDRDTYFLRMAELAATRATCLRRAVGCVLVNDLGHVLATGYNGVAAGLPHCNEPAPWSKAVWDVQSADWRQVYPHACEGSTCDSGTNLEGCEAIHAEQNALLQCRDVQEIATAYTTTPPCVTCTKLLLNTSCRRIVCLGTYPASGHDLWRKAGREWLDIPTNARST